MICLFLIIDFTLLVFSSIFVKVAVLNPEVSAHEDNRKK